MRNYWKLLPVIAVMILNACSTQVNSVSDSEYLVPTKTTIHSTSTPKPTATSIPTRTMEPTMLVTEPTAVMTATPNPFYTPTPIEIVRDLTGEDQYNPLTGMMVADAANLYRRPVMVKISNYPREIRPQAGWSMADIVFEYYLGEGMNRFLALFYGDNPEWAGPIRSGRLVDAQLGMMYDGILVYGGADDRVNSILTNPEILGERAIDTRYNEVCPPLCGDDTHSLEGVFVDPAAMSSYVWQLGIDEGEKQRSLYSMDFADVAAEDGIPGTDIRINISNVCKSRWEYDPVNGNYLRWEESDDFAEQMVPSTDITANGQQLAFENIIVLFSDYVIYDVMLHDIAVVYEDSLLPAMMWRDGQAFSGYWSAEENAPISIWTADGYEYQYKPGRTWYVFVTEDSSMEETIDGSWLIDFSRP